MILLQNPNIPTSVNPVEIDSAIIDIKSELESGLPWLTNGYGRAFKNLDITNGERVYFPEIYLGKQSGSYRYTNVSPDNDKQGQCFFYVRRETISEYQTGMYSFLNYDVAVIFSVNMELINATLTETEVFQQILVAQVRDVLTRQILGKSYVLKVNTVEFLFEDVFREFKLTEQSTIEKSPLSHFRFNISVKMPETCPTPEIPSVVPPDVGSMSVWLKGDSGVNGGSASDGDSVFLWQDQSGNSNHFSQLVAVNQPEYKTSLINGQSGIFVDGAAWMQLLSTVLFTNITEGSVWIVAQQTSPPPSFGNGGTLWGAKPAGFPPFMFLYTERIGAFGNNIYFYGGTGNYKNESILPQDDQPHYIGINKNFAGVSYFGDSNTLISTDLGSENWDSYINYYIGDAIGLGNTTMIGNICEFIVYNKELTPSEITELTNYFNTKYGI